MGSLYRSLDSLPHRAFGYGSMLRVLVGVNTWSARYTHCLVDLPIVVALDITGN